MDVRAIGSGEFAAGEFDREGDARALPSSLAEKEKQNAEAREMAINFR